MGLKPKDKVAFTIDDGGTVRFAAAPFSLESAHGSVKPPTSPEDFDVVTRNAKDSKAEEAARELVES